jgi:hypothetical protein
MKRSMRRNRNQATKVGLMLVGIAVVGAVALVTAEASAKPMRVVALIQTINSGKTWDGGRGKARDPDITLCVGSSRKGTCLPRKGRLPTKKPTKAICKNDTSCWIGCRSKHRIDVSETKRTKVVVWDVDRYRHDKMAELYCTIRKDRLTKCEGKHVTVTFFPYESVNRDSSGRRACELRPSRQ